MFTLFDWGFRLALILPWVAIVISALSLLVPTRRKEELPVTRRAAA
jgi:hypothetical protein